MTIKNNQELYERAREISRELHQLGYEDLGFNIDGALSVSSLPGEVLGELTIALRTAASSRVLESSDLADSIQECLDYTKVVLGA